MFVFFSLAGICKAQGFIKRFSLKFTGGYGTMATGDYNTFGEAKEAYLKDWVETFESMGFRFTKEGEFNKLNLGFEYEGEFILNLFGGFGIGVGAGYIKRSNESEMRVYELGSISNFIKAEFSAVPVNLNAYYFFPITSFVNIFINGGFSYYFGKMIIFREHYEEYPAFSWWEKNESKIKDQSLGFHGGIGFEFNINSKFGFFIEGKGRYCILRGWKGNDTYEHSIGLKEENSGAMWFGEQAALMIGEWYPFFLTVSEEKPTYFNVRNVREQRPFCIFKRKSLKLLTISITQTKKSE